MSTSSSKNKNLLAAKSVLGLDDSGGSNRHGGISGSGIGGGGSSYLNSSLGSSLLLGAGTSHHSSSSRIISNDNPSSIQSMTSRIVATRSQTNSTSITTARAERFLATSGSINTHKSKHSLMHDLSSAARMEARRESNYDPSNNDALLFPSRPYPSPGTSTPSSTRYACTSSSANRRAAAAPNSSSGSRVSHISPGPAPSHSHAPSTHSSHQHQRSSPNYTSESINDASTLEEGSELDSMTAHKPSNSSSRSRASNSYMLGSHLSSSSSSRATTSRAGAGAGADHMNSFRAASASVTRRSSSSSSGTTASRRGSSSSGIIRPNNNKKKKSSMFGTTASDNGSTPKFGMSSSSNFANAFERKEKVPSSAFSRSIDREMYGNSNSTIHPGLKEGLIPPGGDNDRSLLSIQEDGGADNNSMYSANNSLRGDYYDPNARRHNHHRARQLLAVPTFSTTDTDEVQSTTSSSAFQPQRFTEMRALLSAITPLQLEALMLEIFGGTTTTAATLPRGWEATAKKKSRSFRKNAHLSEMSLAELKRYMQDTDVGGMRDCRDLEDALDLIAVEFERLVSVHQSRRQEGGMAYDDDDDDGTTTTIGGESATVDGENSSTMEELRSGQSSSVLSSESMQSSTLLHEDAMSYISSGTNDRKDEGATLRRSLRACSLPELRLVAERLQLDHASCRDNKGDLIVMIEGSMPDMSTDGGGGGSSSSSVGSSSQIRMAMSSQGREEYSEYSRRKGEMTGSGNDDNGNYEHHHHHRQQHYQQQGEMDDDGYHPTHEQGEYDPNQQHQQRRRRPMTMAEQQQMEDDDRDRRVKFANGCKQDTSHLIPKREKRGSWQSFVTSAENQGGGGDGDVEYGEAVGQDGQPLFVGDNHPATNREGGKKKKKKMTLEIPNSIKNVRVPDLSEWSRNQKQLLIVGAVVFILLVIGLSVGLTKQTEGPTDWTAFDANDPFFEGRNRFGDKPTGMPSVMPSVVGSGDGMDGEEGGGGGGQPTSHNAGGDGSDFDIASFFMSPTPEPSQLSAMDAGAPSTMPSSSEEESILGVIGGYAFLDTNNDGLRDPNIESEPPLDDINVWLYSCTPPDLASIIDTTTTTTGANADVMLGMTQTNAQGLYNFVNLMEGYYRVQVQLGGQGYDVSQVWFDEGQDENGKVDNAIDPTTRSTACFELIGGATDISWNIGLIWQDADFDDDDETYSPTTEPTVLETKAPMWWDTPAMVGANGLRDTPAPIAAWFTQPDTPNNDNANTDNDNDTNNNNNNASPAPTPLSPYPLQGPFTLPSQRLILYGISEMNHMGNTQWRMLTAAYMEQFFDMELQGDGGGQDAIQNIVFDVVVSLDIDGEQLLPGRRDLREDGYQRELVEMDEVDDGLLDLPSISQPQRQLQGGIILTFTTTLSYRTFSSFIQTDTVAQRPFYDEIHRKAYVDFLMENNAVSHIGNILGVSEVFLGGEDVPVTPEMVELVEEEEEEGTPAPVTGGPSVSPETLTPSLSPLFQLPQPVLRTNAPTSAREVTSEPSPPPSKTKEVVTPEPTPSPIKEATSEPTTTSKPSLSPSTQKPSLPPTGLATSKPTTKPPTAETYYPTPTALLEAFYPTMTPNLSPDGEGRTGMMATAANVIEEEDEETRPRGTAANVVSEDDETPRPRATAANVIIATSLTKEERPRATAANVITTVPPRDERPKATTPPPSNPPTPPPTNAPTPNPTTSPTKHCPSNSPITTPLCPLLTEYECCAPMCTWDSGGGTNDKCVFINENDTDDIRREVEWLGEFEVGQTHVVKAENEARHAPRIVAQREVELLFTPAGAGNRRLGLGRSHTKSSFSSVSSRIESVGTVYLIKEHSAQPILDASAQRLIDGSQTVFSLPNGTPNIDIIVDLESLRLVEKVSFLLHGDASLKTAQLGLHYDDGRNQEEDDGFHLPSSSWTWFDMLSSESNIGERLMGRISISIPKDGARYVMIRLVGGSSGSLAHDHWGFGQIEIVGSMDGLSSTELSSQQGSNGANSILPMTRSIDPSYATTTTTTTSSRSFTPSTTTSVRIAVYSPTGHLIGATTARDPTKQRGILESRLSPLQIQDYSDMIWSATLPYNWIEEGNVVLIGCVDESRQREMLVRRLELVNLAQFSEHTISRTKMAIFGTESQVLSQLDSHTHDAKRLVRNLYSVMPVAELKWADTDLWHLPYIVIMGPDGPALVNSEEERREVTGDGEGTEISWRVMKNYLTIRHSLANTGHGLVVTSETGENSPYASGTSVFMGWSLSNRQQHDDEDDEWNWEDLGYWDTLAAAAWTGWVAMKAGDECSNYFVHEMGHAQTMQHFDEGAASNWGIADEYPQDGKHMDHHPWGYDTVSRQFRTWFDPFQGDGKLDPLNGAGEGPTSDQCFSQYTPYQAKKSQEWATATPILLSASSSGVATDGAYKFDTSTRQYSPLGGALLADAVGAAAMEPDQVGIPVITLIGTIGSDTSVCQTYPALRSRSGNTFQFPDPFNPDLPGAYYGAAHFFEVRFDGGRTVRGLIAVEGDLTEKSLKFFSFNVAIHRKPMSVGLYRFTDGSYPHLSPLSGTELLHLRPTGLHPYTPLMGLPPLLRVGRGWLGDSSDIVLDRFCVTAEDCDSGAYHVNWRSHVGSDSVIYASSLAPEPQQLLGSTIFKIPAKTEWGDTEYTITVLATRFFNDGLGSSPLLTTYPPSDDGSSDIDATHSIRVVAPWEMNALPAGTYHSVPGALTISAEAVGGGGSGNYHLLDLHISLNLGTITEPPTSSPTKRPTPGPSQSPVQVRYYIDWNDFTCVTDGESTEWAPPYASKEYCCRSHMAYDFAMCMRDEQ